MGYGAPVLLWGMALLFLAFGSIWLIVQAVRNYRQGRKGVALTQAAIVLLPPLFLILAIWAS
jgi:hypothetical protein